MGSNAVGLSAETILDIPKIFGVPIETIDSEEYSPECFQESAENDYASD